MKPFAFVKLTDLKSGLTQKTNTGAFLSGGTNLIDLMKKHIAEPDTLMDVTSVLPATITATPTGMSIGAMVRNSSIANDKTILAKYPLIAKAVLAGATPQIRNMASTGGNLLQRTRCPYFYDTTLPCNKRKPGSGCGAYEGNNRISAIAGYSKDCVAVHPSDLCVALAAMDATVVVKDKRNGKNKIAFADFHRLPGTTPDLDNNLGSNEIIDSVELPAAKFTKHTAYVKLRDRDSYAFALISVAAALQLNGNIITDLRLASGGVAHKPWRWLASEKFLKGKPATLQNFTEAAEIAVKETKPLKDNAYKVSLLRGAIISALENCLTA